MRCASADDGPRAPLDVIRRSRPVPYRPAGNARGAFRAARVGAQNGMADSRESGARPGARTTAVGSYMTITLRTSGGPWGTEMPDAGAACPANTRVGCPDYAPAARAGA